MSSTFTKAQQASGASRYIFLSAFSFLTALLIRDMFQYLWKWMIDAITRGKSLFSDWVDRNAGAWNFITQLILVVIVFSITLSMAIGWPYTEGSFIL
jgi:hypothetical protein